MKISFKNINKCITWFCLLIYVLFVFLNTSAISVCYGTETSKHYAINIGGDESCCGKKEITNQSEINSPKSSQPSYQSNCNCIDKKIVLDNQLQQILTNNISNVSSEINNVINSQVLPVLLCFEEKYNKVNWDIYSYRRIDNQIAALKTIILII